MEYLFEDMNPGDCEVSEIKWCILEESLRGFSFSSDRKRLKLSQEKIDGQS